MMFSWQCHENIIALDSHFHDIVMAMWMDCKCVSYFCTAPRPFYFQCSVQSTCWGQTDKRKNNTLRRHWQHIDNTLTTHRESTDNTLTAHWTTLTVNWNTLTVNWQYTDNRLTIHWQCTGNTLTTHWQHTDITLSWHHLSWHITQTFFIFTQFCCFIAVNLKWLFSLVCVHSIVS